MKLNIGRRFHEKGSSMVAVFITNASHRDLLDYGSRVVDKTIIFLHGDQPSAHMLSEFSHYSHPQYPK